MLGRRDRPDPGRIHQDPEQIAVLRPGLGGARLYGGGRGAVRGLGARPGSRRFRAPRSRSSGCPGAPRSSSSTSRARAHDTVLLYGHLDKQPEMVGWAEGYGPWIPRLEGDKLYGRGGADDGYAMFGALSALAGIARATGGACALRRPDRGVRGIRQLRPALLRRSPRRTDRQPVAGGVSRFRLRQLRSAVADHVIARRGVGHADGSGARRGCAFGRRLRCRPVELSDSAPAVVAPRGRGNRGRPSGGALRPGSARAGGAGPARRRGAGRHGLYQVSADAAACRRCQTI